MKYKIKHGAFKLHTKDRTKAFLKITKLTNTWFYKIWHDSQSDPETEDKYFYYLLPIFSVTDNPGIFLLRIYTRFHSKIFELYYLKI